jgi:hypothetical protein
VNTDILGSKIGALETSPQEENKDFLKNDFDYIPVIYGDILPKRNCIDDIFRKITVRTLRVQT